MAQCQCSNTAPILKQSTAAKTSTISSRYVAFVSLDAWNKDRITIKHQFPEGIGMLVYPYIQRPYRPQQWMNVQEMRHPKLKTKILKKMQTET